MSDDDESPGAALEREPYEWEHKKRREVENHPTLMCVRRDSEPSEDVLLSDQDMDARRAAFLASTGHAPEEWLARWRRGEFLDNMENNLTANLAGFLA